MTHKRSLRGPTPPSTKESNKRLEVAGVARLSIMRQPPMASTTFFCAHSRFDDEVKFGAPGFGISGLVIIPVRKNVWALLFGK
ncbi:hypothetical protein CDAR_264961 [Caerostris darwini]|uniref:Uncharacterized protein n=1 Tax=Caerostris darwini TaxID=1538125 RepID=A0AAV4W4Y1_9ARAC|nr:hypothetical protein CDAR_264961 [Caerostris darwini]